MCTGATRPSIASSTRSDVLFLPAPLIRRLSASVHGAARDRLAAMTRGAAITILLALTVILAGAAVWTVVLFA